MSLMKKRWPWFKTVLLVAMVCGIAGYWYVDSWLEPGPQVFKLDQLVPPHLTIHDYGFDLSHRWLDVLAKPQEDNLQVDQPHLVFDLDQNGRQVNEFSWKQLPNNLFTTQQRYGGVRQVRHQANDDLVVVDQSFVDGKSQTRRLGSYLPLSIRHILVAEEGERVVVIYYLPMWLFSTLCNTGQPPFINLHYFNRIGIAEVWDVSTGQRMNRLALTAPRLGNQLLSADGQWLVLLEAESQPDSNTLTKQSQVKPSLPRGVQIVNTTTGERRTILEEPYEQELFGAYEGKIVGDQLMLFHSKRTRGPGPTGSSQYSNRDSKNNSLTSYDLATGKESEWLRPEGQSWFEPHESPCGLREATWLAFQHSEPRLWPGFLSKIARWLNYDLNGNYPLGCFWDVTFLDAATRKIRYQKSYPIPLPWGQIVNNEVNKSGSLVMEIRNGGARDHMIYRWKVPFTIYSPWWARGAGVLVAVLILACYGMVVRRGRQRLI